MSACRCKGSGTFSVEAAVNTLVPRDGHVLVLINGAYGKRMARLTEMMGRKLSTFETADDVPTTADDVERLLARDPSITHVGLIHCETSTGILNPLRGNRRRRRASRQEPYRRCDELVRRAADRRAHDAVRCACRGVGQVRRRSTRHGLRVREARQCWSAAPATRTSLALDLHDQWSYMEKTTQWRFTPPTHIVVALDAALDQFAAEGGQPARLARYAANCATLVQGMAELGLRPFLEASIQAPIIVTFHAPTDPRYTFREFYDRVRDKGFILYPGKLTQVETFRVGCIGAIGPDEMRQAVNAIRETLAEMGIAQAASAAVRRAAA